MIRLMYRLILVLIITALLASCGAPTAEPDTTGTTESPATEAGTTPETTEATPDAAATPEVGVTPETTEATPDAEAAPDAGAGAADLSGEIPVGFVFSLTGGAALYGTSQRNAVEMAVEEINESGMLGDATIRAFIEDDAGRPETATTVFETLINQNNVVAIIGPTLSNAALSADPIAQEAGVPVVAVSNTAAGITEIGDYIFRVSLPESMVIPNTVEVTKEELGYDRVAIMYANDDAFSRSGYEVFRQALQDQGVEIATEQTFSTNDTDFSPQLTQIRNIDPAPEALIVSALAQPAAGILTQASQLGLDLPVIGGNGFNSPQLSELAGEAADGVIAGAAWIVTNTNPRNREFVEAYNERYGNNPDQFAAQAYAGTYILAQAIANAGSAERDAIRDALDQIENLDTVLGNFSFENREPQHTPVVQQLQDGQFQVFP
jgi:branched-chain amino acid transport system substrate-binding protein